MRGADDHDDITFVHARGYLRRLRACRARAAAAKALTVQNRAQPFLKVTLPTGATIVSVTVAGQSAKPVFGPDGTRVPLLRPGFLPTGPYAVSFVYLHPGTPFAKKGDLQMTLPKMDMPVGIVEWEVFVPANYSVRVRDGNVIERLAESSGIAPGSFGSVVRGVVGGVAGGAIGGVQVTTAADAIPGQIKGQAKDANGRTPLDLAKGVTGNGRGAAEAFPKTVALLESLMAARKGK